MFEYYAYLHCSHKEHVVQTVLYLGREPLRLPPRYSTPSLDFRFEIVRLREYDADLLLASDDWADIALSLLATGDREKVLSVAVSRLRQMGREERGWASGTSILFSGMLEMEDTVNERMKEAGTLLSAAAKKLSIMANR